AAEAGAAAERRVGEGAVGLEELVDRRAAGAHEQFGEVVEVAVEDRAAEPGLAHDLVDAELAVGRAAHELGRRRNDPLPALFTGVTYLGAMRGHGRHNTRMLTLCDTRCSFGRGLKRQ